MSESPSASVVSVSSSGRRHHGWAYESFEDDTELLTPETVTAYTLLYDRLNNLIERGCIAKRHLDLSFSHLELTQLLAANFHYDYSIKPKTKAAYVQDLMQFILEGKGLMTPKQVKETYEQQQKDRAVVLTERGKKKKGDQESHYQDIIDRLHRIYEESQNRLTVESVSVQMKFTDQELASVIAFNAEQNQMNNQNNGKTKSKAQLAASIEKLIQDGKLKGWTPIPNIKALQQKAKEMEREKTAKAPVNQSNAAINGKRSRKESEEESVGEEKKNKSRSGNGNEKKVKTEKDNLKAKSRESTDLPSAPIPPPSRSGANGNRHHREFQGEKEPEGEKDHVSGREKDESSREKERHKHRKEGEKDKDNSSQGEKVKVKLQVTGPGVNKFFLVPEGKKFKYLLEKMSSVPEIAQSGKIPRLSYMGIPLMDHDTPASKGLISDAVLTLELV